MKRFAGPQKDKLVASVPPVPGLRLVRVQIELGAIRIQVEHVRITITVGYVQNAIYTTAP